MQMGADNSDGDLTHRHRHNRSFQAMCEEVVRELQQWRPFWGEKSIVEVGGWNGVGRRRVLRRVVHILTTPSSSSSSSSPVFRHLVRMPKQEDEAEIQRRIRERILSDNSLYNDSWYALGTNWIRLQWDSYQCLLVAIEQDLTRHINPEAIIEQRETNFYPVMRIVAPERPPPGDDDDNDDHQSMPTANSDYAYHMSHKFENLPPEDAWELLQYEIAEIDEELRRPGSDQPPSLQWNQQLRFSHDDDDGHIFGDADIIMECFLYAALFMTPIDFPLYLWCEGCRTLTNTTTYNDFSDSIGLLLNKFKERSLLSAKGTIRRPLLNKIPAIATTLPRFMVQINKGLKEFPSPPPTIDHGEHARGVTRIYLQSNQIERLQHLLPSLAVDDDNSSHSQGTSDDTLLPNTSDPSSLDYYEHLSTLILSFNPMSKGIQTDFFQPENADVTIMPNLRVLDLSFCEQLESLPTSIQSLVNLRLLNLRSCTNLKTISSCLEQTDALPNLQVLDITDCPLQEMTEASFRSMPNLWLILSNEQTLLNVEMLDFSSTKIKTFPDVLSGISRKKLNHLLLIDTKNLSSVNWDRFTQIPNSIIWDQCGCCTPINTINDTHCFRICVEDVRIFTGLSPYHDLCRINDFQEFHIHIRPCTGQPRQHSSSNHPSPRHQHHHHGRHPHKREYPSSSYYKNLRNNNNIPKRKQVQEYVDEHQFVSDDASSNPAIAFKYLHICGVPTNFSVSIQGVFSHIHFLRLYNCDTIKHMEITDDMKLRSCQVIKCPSMEKLFYRGPHFDSDIDFSRLKSIKLFHLINLRTLYEGNLYIEAFKNLKRVFVDSCPRLVLLFSSTPKMYVFPSLEELVIKSCGKLKDIFGEGADGEKVAPKLKSLYLWDLPELRRVCDGYLKSLKSVQLRGCSKLGKLPIHDGDAPPPEVSAETKWWEKLSEENKKHISNFRPLNMPRPTSQL